MSQKSTHRGNTLISIDGGRTTIELRGITASTLKTSEFTGHSSSEFTHHKH
jgi:hypothetical protein